MKKADVKIGGKYYANVSGKRTEIQINAEKPRGGWDATNLATGKKVLIKSAQRLQAEVGAKRGRSKATIAEAASESEMEPATVDATSIEPSTSVAVLKNPRKAKVAKEESATAGEKKLSCVGAALKVLAESGQPLNTKEMIEAMEAKGYWTSPGGKTPHATLYSAILRDLAAGHAARFVKTERGRFAVRS